MELAKTATEREMNSLNDNPVIDATLNRVYHTGNFYGGHIARVMDGLKIDLANIANWAHALMALLVDPRFSNGLPANLVQAPQRLQGHAAMPDQFGGCLPANGWTGSIHTLPTEQYNQDIVSLGLHSSLTAYEMSSMVRDSLAILLITLCQSQIYAKRPNRALDSDRSRARFMGLCETRCAFWKLIAPCMPRLN
jgi:phenylalanine ammonia-lyase